jgi:hypothetical protein
MGRFELNANLRAVPHSNHQSATYPFQSSVTRGGIWGEREDYTEEGMARGFRQEVEEERGRRSIPEVKVMSE